MSDRELIRRWKSFDHYEDEGMDGIALLDENDNEIDRFSDWNDVIQGWIDCQIAEKQRKLKEEVV